MKPKIRRFKMNGLLLILTEVSDINMKMLGTIETDWVDRAENGSYIEIQCNINF